MKKEFMVEVERMCRQCHNVEDDGSCEEMEVEEQIKRAADGLCSQAEILGGTFGLPYNKMRIVLGDMIIDKGDWIFKGQNYNRISETYIDTDANEWPT